MNWIGHAEPYTRPLVSVVLPTRDRAHLLVRAIESVVRQTYSNWELLIIDDDSRDATPDVFTSLSEERVRVFTASGLGVCAARNVGLASAHGQLITYLDDDNWMHPEWLKSVVWAFEQHPDVNVLYGAFAVDDFGRILSESERPSRHLPQVFFNPYDHDAVVHSNVADIGAIAHRADLPEAHFDESLREMGDWDLLLRLTREHPPLELPAIACYYTTDAPNRLSGGPTFERDMAAVRAKNRR